MAWRMTVVIPPELEEAIRTEEHETRTPISRIIREMLTRRYSAETVKRNRTRVFATSSDKEA